MNCLQQRDLILELVLGEMASAEATVLRAHIDTGCPQCAEYLAEAEELELALSLSPDPVAPSPEAKRALLERLDSRPSLQAGEAASASQRTSRRRDARYPNWAVAGLSALAAGLAAFAIFSPRYSDTTAQGEELAAALALVQAEHAELRADFEAAQAELESADSELAELEEQIRNLETDVQVASKQLAMLRSDSVIAMEIRGTELQPDATARVFWGEDYYCYLSAKNLRPLAQGRSYALWLDTANDGIVAAGTLAQGSSGSATLWVPLDSDLGEIRRAFLTEEPEGDLAQEPTGAIELESSVLPRA